MSSVITVLQLQHDGPKDIWSALIDDFPTELAGDIVTFLPDPEFLFTLEI